jgi:hypothetical protein
MKELEEALMDRTTASMNRRHKNQTLNYCTIILDDEAWTRIMKSNKTDSSTLDSSKADMKKGNQRSKIKEY